eukprot:TRINITY_DN31050_c0_g1_i1.p1 TRINITY_DN31050_c0_g1~~TRINITY_DN31050_c0_g1_i1.p1  ORF type:complete len:383 (-),score=77.62 TRINITY_DN31050_c0_g1_i1:650-1798(-)
MVLFKKSTYKSWRSIMGRIFNDNSLSIGNTPLVKLNKLNEDGKATILAKIEGRNPAYSVKCRIGANLIWDAEKRGLLKPGVEIIEPTSGNTGIALAYVAASRGYKLTLTMPDTMSIERRKLLAAFGANLILTPGAEGMKGAVKLAEEIAGSDLKRYFLPQQFNNPANPEIHEKTTGPEIWDDTDGNVDVLVAGIGTGGTITGISRYLKRTKGKPLMSVGVEPSASPILSQHLKGEVIKPGPHKIQGIGAGFIPGVLDLSLLDRVEAVDDAEAIEFARRAGREEGILCGISSGAALAVAVRLSQNEEFAGKTIVVILPDSGERYLSSVLYEDLSTQQKPRFKQTKNDDRGGMAAWNRQRTSQLWKQFSIPEKQLFQNRAIYMI